LTTYKELHTIINREVFIIIDVNPGRYISIEFSIFGIIAASLGILMLIFPYRVQKIDLKTDYWLNK
jgi:hypothetical protein